MSYIVGVCGGSGSGKTTFANNLYQQLIADGVSATVISFDDYYKHEPGMTAEQRAQYNFDVPEALDGYLLVDDLAKLKRGESIEAPLYDFATQTRKQETRHVDPSDVIIVEGILIFAEEALRNSFDLTCYIDVPTDIRLVRRFVRDIDERAHSAQSVAALYLNAARDAHAIYVEPYRATSDVVINDAFNETTIKLIAAGIEGVIR